jgi:Ca-activated chloride channel family protein
MIRAGAAVIGLAGALAVPLSGQQPQIFRGGTDVVSLSVTVVDQQGRFVSGLTPADFEVYEDGVRQTITQFASDAQPVALSLLVDTSTSMEPHMAVAQKAAVGFVQRLGPMDVAQILDFDSQATIVQQYTGEQAALEAAIRKLQAGGSTSLYTALYLVLRGSEYKAGGQSESAIRRWAIVVLSDGEDTTSRLDYETVLEESKRSDFTVYAIGLREKKPPEQRGYQESEFVLRTLSQETGGRVFFVEDAAQLPAIYQQISEELNNQYTLGYTSTNLARDGKWRRLQLRVTRPDTTARTRTGYFGPKDPGRR